METHSEKGLKTLQMMGTKPQDWGMCEIVWKEEMRLRPVKVPCAHCGGRISTYKLQSGATHSEPIYGDGEAFEKTGVAYDNAAMEIEKAKILKARGVTWNAYMNDQELERAGFTKVRCPHCDHRPYRQNACGYNNSRNYGYKTELKMCKVMVGYPQWAKATNFNSRFRHSDCNLCGKTLKRGDAYPVTGRGDDGIIHGMWVGADCAQKFLGIKNFKKTENQVMSYEYEKEAK